MLFNGVQSLQAPGTGQAHIEQHGVGAGTVEQTVGLFGALRYLGVEAEGLRYLAAGLADGPVVVHDQKVEEICSLDLGWMGMAVAVRMDGEGGSGRCGEHSE